MISIFCFGLNVVCVTAQNGPLYGSGKIETKTFDFVNFDKISIKDFDGSIKVDVGNSYAIKVEIDDNIAPRLRAELKNKKLFLYLEGNTNGKLYLEATNITIHVSLPLLYSVEHRGNTSLDISGVKVNNFFIDQSGNGNVTITGEANLLHINKNGNGNVDAKRFKSLTAKVKSYGNGNVMVNTQISLSARGRGNGDIIQFGKGKIEALSGIIGNGDVRVIFEQK